MNDKYKGCISYGSKAIAKVKVFLPQSDSHRQDQKLDAPEFHSGGIKLTIFISSTGCVDPIHPNPTKKVHFSAYLTKTKTFNSGNVVKFDDVEPKKGSGYSPSTGVFTCPQSGVYQVTWFFINNNKQSSRTPQWLQLDVNEKVYALAGLNVDQPHNPAFRSHLVSLEKGDRLRIVAHVNNMVVYGEGSRHTGFSALYVSA